MYAQHGYQQHHQGHGSDSSFSNSFDSMSHHQQSAPWAQQDMHYGGTNNSNSAYAGGASHGLYGAGGYYGSGGMQPSGATGGYAAYGMQQAPQSAATQYNGAAATGTTASTQHSGASTPTSQSAYGHHHSMGSVVPSPSGYSGQAQQQPQGGYYGSGGAGNMMSPSYTSAPQYSTQLPLAGRHRVTTTLWEDEGTLCFQVDARGVCVARRHDNNMINGTKLLNVCGMSRGKRDGILKNEKERIVVKVGAMHLKGVWITFPRGKQLAEQNGILDVLYPLFETNIQSFLYHPDNYPRTAAVMQAAQERQAQRSRAPVAESPSSYQRSASNSSVASGVLGNGGNGSQARAPTNGGASAATGASYGQHAGYSGMPSSYSQGGHNGLPPPQPHGMQGASAAQRSSSGDRRHSMQMAGGDQMSPYQGMMPKQRSSAGYSRKFEDGAEAGSFGP